MTLGLRSKLAIAFLVVILVPVGFYIIFFIFTIQDLVTEVETLQPINITKNVISKIESSYSMIEDNDRFNKELRPLLDKYNIKLQVFESSGTMLYDSENIGSSINNNIDIKSLNSFAINNDKVYKYIGPLTTDNDGKAVASLVFNTDQLYQGTQQNVAKLLIIGFVFSLLLFILLIYSLSRIISRDILVPLKDLNIATKKISEGDLDKGIEYRKSNEIGEFCQAFDLMRVKLKKSLEKQAIYENNRKELIASISHDLRTPISSIKGYVEGLQDGIVQDKVKFDRYLTIIKDKTEKLDYLIDDLFHFSRMELGQLDVEKETCNSRELFLDLFNSIELNFTDKNVDFIIERPLPQRLISVDKKRISQVVDNLIKNAETYVGTSGKIKVGAALKEGFLRISIKDNGIGIDKEDLPHIFDKFYRGEKSRSRDYGGAGLGLAICKQIIETHGGKMWAKSIKGIGTTFYFTIPLTKETKHLE